MTFDLQKFTEENGEEPGLRFKGHKGEDLTYDEIEAKGAGTIAALYSAMKAYCEDVRLKMAQQPMPISAG